MARALQLHVVDSRWCSAPSLRVANQRVLDHIVGEHGRQLDLQRLASLLELQGAIRLPLPFQGLLAEPSVAPVGARRRQQITLAEQILELSRWASPGVLTWPRLNAVRGRRSWDHEHAFLHARIVRVLPSRASLRSAASQARRTRGRVEGQG